MPEKDERLGHGETYFFIQDRRMHCQCEEDHNGNGQVSIWCPAPVDVRRELAKGARCSPIEAP